jgi:hypothetical protein
MAMSTTPRVARGDGDILGTAGLVVGEWLGSRESRGECPATGGDWTTGATTVGCSAWGFGEPDGAVVGPDAQARMLTAAMQLKRTCAGFTI